MSSVAQSTDFVDLTTIITAEWLNAVDAVIFDLMGGPETITEFAAAIGGQFEGLHNLGAPTTAGLAIVSTGPNSFAYYPVLDEDDMASDRADAICTQQSIKAYAQADLSITAFLDEDNMATDSSTAAASQQSIKAYADGLAAAIGAWNLGTPLDTTTSTSYGFSSLPTTPPISVLFFSLVEVSATTTGTGAPTFMVQLGDATTGDFVTTGYQCASTFLTTTAATATSASGILINNDAAASKWNGTICVTLADSSAFSYTVSYVLGESGGTKSMVGAGGVTLAALMDRIRIISVNGVDTFDNGVVNILYSQ